ncbi:LacI family transcriptional regulator [Skermanella stibiiresistens SB22]|uniref:LacI family transcriptional regulator n=1 Tax=Skermanella stibiiresistens SB22 TaxID=1385369 RepID=W9GWP4_9PROT|nr:LacI family DNA-binding transcriptional regulator [Skermanella stibiiresistens]EWY38320.1 LacI family transcriptional regulator [Skermanella stibiiresistens SB22]
MNEMTRQPATLQAVADAAGVHRSTASRALNPDKAHLIGPDVVERVQAAARRIGYQRDELAAGLRTKRSRLIGIVVPDLANLVFAPIVSAIETVLAANGYSALIANAGGGVARQIQIIDQLIAHRVEGVILATAQRDDPVVTRCAEAGVPAVLVNRAEEKARVSTVISNDICGMRLAVEHLVALGHRRIGHIGGPSHLSTGALRLEGFGKAMAEAGLDADAVVTAEAYTRDAGRAAAIELLDRHDLTAVATANDLLALGLYQELRARGLRCPDDISVVGHNDMPMIDMVDPPLTTVHIHQADMGRQAAELLLARIGKPETDTVTRVIDSELVVRGSTAPPRG